MKQTTHTFFKQQKEEEEKKNNYQVSLHIYIKTKKYVIVSGDIFYCFFITVDKIFVCKNQHHKAVIADC